MILVVGGIASGKRAHARSLGYAQASFTPACDVYEGARAQVALDAQELPRQAGYDAKRALDALAGCEVVLFTEVGSGIVPLDASERAWREQAGRLCCELAARADKVVRMVCGIPVALKE